MIVLRVHTVVGLVSLLAACNGSAMTGRDGATGNDSAPYDDGSHGLDGAPVSDVTVDTPPQQQDVGPSTDTGPGGCEALGHFGTPTSTFVLPAQGTAGNLTLNYPDVQASFPGTHWATLDRLYLPAGSYKSLLIGNLPTRDPAHPLVITNHGGQVFIGNNPTGNYIWSMTGGAGWVLTGRYDATSQTGDIGFQGHRCGHYANDEGTYGIVSDDGFAFTAPYLHMGIGVGNATDFEIEYVEVRRSGFAGIRLLNARNAGDPEHPMANVRVHDVYVHDTGAEGFYFGWTGAPPSNPFPGLQIYNVRIVRTGNEALQIQDLADGTHVHHNVFASAGLHWLDNGLGRYQDNGAQIVSRSGTIEIDHNLVIDGAGTIVSFWSEPETGDPARHVTLHDNLFADTRDIGIYFNGTSAAGSSFTFQNNFFRGLTYGYDDVTPGGQHPTAVFGFNNALMAPVALVGNTWEGALAIAPGITSGAGTSGIVTASGNTNATVVAATFVNAGYPVDNAGHHLTAWAPRATVAGGSATVTYHPGDVVADGPNNDLYECTGTTSAGPPPMHPEAWMALPRPVDDLRTAPGSPYAAMGIQ